jgi:hypothetical protein
MVDLVIGCVDQFFHGAFGDGYLFPFSDADHRHAFGEGYLFPFSEAAAPNRAVGTEREELGIAPSVAMDGDLDDLSHVLSSPLGSIA